MDNEIAMDDHKNTLLDAACKQMETAIIALSHAADHLRRLEDKYGWDTEAGLIESSCAKVGAAYEIGRAHV